MACSRATGLFLAVVLSTALALASASDPDITSDFVLPDGVPPSSSLFTFTGLRDALNGPAPQAPFRVTKASQVEFPGLLGQGVSMAVLQFAPGGMNPLHTHPRSAELLLVVRGRLEVGFVDSGNKLFRQVLDVGDSFVFPKGLVHFQVNWDGRYPAVAISAFGSANAGTVSLPKALFGSGIDQGALAKSFNTNRGVIQNLVGATN